MHLSNETRDWDMVRNKGSELVWQGISCSCFLGSWEWSKIGSKGMQLEKKFLDIVRFNLFLVFFFTFLNYCKTQKSKNNYIITVVHQ